MLRKNLFPFILYVAAVLIWAFSLLQCKTDTSTQTAAEAIYLADYEKPANLWGYIRKDGTWAIPAQFDAVTAFSEDVAAVNADGKWGYINAQGDWVIQPVYREAGPFRQGRARVVSFDTIPHFIDLHGNRYGLVDWEADGDFNDGLAKVKSGSAYGFVDTTGDQRIPALYSQAWNFEWHHAIVEYNGKIGVIDTNGQFRIPAIYDKIKRSHNRQYFMAQSGVKSVLFTASGKEILQIAPGRMIDTDGTLIAVDRASEKWLYNIRKKNWQYNKGYLQLYYLGDSRWAARDAEGYALLDETGQSLSEKRYQQIYQFKQGMAVCQRDEYWCFLNLQGDELIQPSFGLAWDFADGLARVAFQDGIGYINEKMELAFYPPEGSVDLRDFHLGLAPVQSVNK